MTESRKKEEKREVVESQKPGTGDEDSWSTDQKRRGYYYDDACGYEIYNPDEEENEEKQPISDQTKSY
jgi:hypothetical protein